MSGTPASNAVQFAARPRTLAALRKRYPVDWAVIHDMAKVQVAKDRPDATRQQKHSAAQKLAEKTFVDMYQEEYDDLRPLIVAEVKREQGYVDGRKDPAAAAAQSRRAAALARDSRGWFVPASA